MVATFATLSEVRRVNFADGEVAHSATFDDRTSIWSVNGGYLASAALRAAEDVSEFNRPSSVSLQFIRPVTPGETTIATTSLHRSSSAAELLESRLNQNGKLCAVCHTWTFTGRDGPIVREARMPPAPHPDELQPLHVVMAGQARHPFWDIFDERQINGVDIGQRRNRRPRSLRWMRYKGDLASGSPYLKAGLTIPIIDMLGIPAATNARGHSVLTSLAPTIQLAAHFYELDALDGWLLGDAYAESVGDGLINTRVRIWSLGGALVAQGLTQMIFKAGKGAYVTGRQ